MPSKVSAVRRVSRCDLKRKLQERLPTGSRGNVESSEASSSSDWFVCTDRTWFNSLWPANVSRSKNSRRITMLQHRADSIRSSGQAHRPFGTRYIPRSSPPAVNLTCFSCAIWACAWWCRAVAFIIVLRLFIFHNERDDTAGFLPRQPNMWYVCETLGTIYGGQRVTSR